MPIVTATRRLRFNAAHRIHNPALSDAENTRLFGKCNNPHGHGHNYVLEVSVDGEVDPATGYLIDMKVLKDVVRGTVKEVDARGAVIDLGNGIEGQLRASELARDRVEDARTVLKEGDEVEAKFTGVDRKTRRSSSASLTRCRTSWRPMNSASEMAPTVRAMVGVMVEVA